MIRRPEGCRCKECEGDFMRALRDLGITGSIARSMWTGIFLVAGPDERDDLWDDE